MENDVVQQSANMSHFDHDSKAQKNEVDESLSESRFRTDENGPEYSD